jgi:hypothetical protein
VLDKHGAKWGTGCCCGYSNRFQQRISEIMRLEIVPGIAEDIRPEWKEAADGMRNWKRGLGMFSSPVPSEVGTNTYGYLQRSGTEVVRTGV